MERSFSNFSAYYFPDITLTNNEQPLTLVNSFRILFNNNFGTDIVINDLKRLPGYGQGMIVLTEDSFIRDTKKNQIVAIK